MDTMRTALAGEACLAPTKPCGGKAIEVILLPLQGAHELRLFIPKHHCRLLRARRASPYGGGSITACHGAPLQPQCNLKIRSAHFTGEACLAPTKPCGGKAIDVILLPLQGAKMWVSVPPKALPWAEFCCPFGAKKHPRRR